MMQVIITDYPDPLVTLDEVKVALGESGDDRDDLISGFVLAAQAELDGPKGWVGISIAQQSVEARFDTFDDVPLRLPGGPIIGDVVLSYLDSDGVTQIMDTADYLVAADGTLSLIAGGSWPTIADQSGAIQAAYDVGLVEIEGDPRLQLMKTAIILHVRMTMDGVDPDTSRRAIESLVRSMWVPVL